MYIHTCHLIGHHYFHRSPHPLVIKDTLIAGMNSCLGPLAASEFLPLLHSSNKKEHITHHATSVLKISFWLVSFLLLVKADVLTIFEEPWIRCSMQLLQCHPALFLSHWLLLWLLPKTNSVTADLWTCSVALDPLYFLFSLLRPSAATRAHYSSMASLSGSWQFFSAENGFQSPRRLPKILHEVYFLYH